MLFRSPGASVFYLGRVSVRGRVSPGTVVMLTLGWLDRAQRVLPTTVIRLPDGDWNDWSVLSLMVPPPVGAVWVGMGIRVQYQVAGDWAELRDFSLQVVR